MSTPHNRAEKGDFAKTVLMPGDPLRAKFIAETFLENPRLVTDVRGMYGFTGTYQGRPISVMGSGMGMPSIGIYSYELFSQYGVENIIRIGSAGSYTDKAKLFDVVLATGAYSGEQLRCDPERRHRRHPAAQLRAEQRPACQRRRPEHSSDRGQHPFLGRVLPPAQRCQADLLGKAAGREGLPGRRDGELRPFPQCQGAGQARRLPVDHLDSFVSPEITTAEQRQTSFTEMMKVALGVDAYLEK